jgi:hypothetical protein
MPSLAIPDGSLSGVSQTIDFPATIASITEVSVELELIGGFTGDYYAYLQHGSGFAVLLNRSGRTSNSGAGSVGYLDGGFDITLREGAANGDIHNYQSISAPDGGVLTGLWEPDGRNVSPLGVLGTEARTATLTAFAGMHGGGDWTLFVADLSSGGAGTLEGWTLAVTGVAVPEPTAVVIVSAVALLMVGGIRKVQVICGGYFRR